MGLWPLLRLRFYGWNEGQRSTGWLGHVRGRDMVELVPRKVFLTRGQPCLAPFDIIIAKRRVLCSSCTSTPPHLCNVFITLIITSTGHSPSSPFSPEARSPFLCVRRSLQRFLPA